MLFDDLAWCICEKRHSLPSASQELNRIGFRLREAFRPAVPEGVECGCLTAPEGRSRIQDSLISAHGAYSGHFPMTETRTTDPE